MNKRFFALLTAVSLCASTQALEMPYVWENLTMDDFKAAVSNSQGVVVVPIGCVEMHNHHLPVGTDYLAANDIVRAALTKEPALMFTFGLYGAVREARHQFGTIALSSNTLRAMLEDLCEEFARNGLTDIIFWNDHGGNLEFMREFVRSRLEKPRPYRVYFRNDGFLGAQYRDLYSKFTIPKEWGHACIMETSLMLATHPELVFMDRLNREEATPLNRFAELSKMKIETPYDWYSTAPNQAYGDPSGATKELGEWEFRTSVSNLIETVRLVKRHQGLVTGLQREFETLSERRRGGLAK